MPAMSSGSPLARRLACLESAYVGLVSSAVIHVCLSVSVVSIQERSVDNAGDNVAPGDHA